LFNIAEHFTNFTPVKYLFDSFLASKAGIHPLFNFVITDNVSGKQEVPPKPIKALLAEIH
jgi:hypothetical protein